MTEISTVIFKKFCHACGGEIDGRAEKAPGGAR